MTGIFFCVGMCFQASALPEFVGPEHGDDLLVVDQVATCSGSTSAAREVVPDDEAEFPAEHTSRRVMSSIAA